MSDCNNYGEIPDEPSGDKSLNCLEKNCNIENLGASDYYAECDINLYNRLVYTTNSLLYDGSYSVCSTPSSTPDTDRNNLSLPNIFECSSDNAASESIRLKKEETNLSCEDCNIMEELLQYPTHLSLYDVERKKLSNSITKTRNTCRYDGFLALDAEEQTDVESCGRCSESEFADDRNDMLDSSDGNMRDIFLKGIDNMLDPNSDRLQLVPTFEPTEAGDSFSTDLSKRNSASDAGASYCSTNENGPSCDVTSEEASSKSGSQTSRALSRYEIMKQRKIAKSQRQHSKDSVAVKVRGKSDDVHRSIEQLVSFIEGKDATAAYLDKNVVEDADANQKSDHLLGAVRKQTVKKKKRRDRFSNKLETVGSLSTFESSPATERLPDFKNHRVDEEMISVVEHPALSSQLLCDGASKVTSDLRQSKSDDQTSLLYSDGFNQSNAKLSNGSFESLEASLSKSNDHSNAELFENTNNNNDDDAKTIRKSERGASGSVSRDLLPNLPEGSRYDAVDGFPEASRASRDNERSAANVGRRSNSNFNNYHHDEESKLSGDRGRRATEDEDKLTEFSYSTNTNSSCDEQSSKESEREEFVTVQKKKKIRTHDRHSRHFRGAFGPDKQNGAGAKDVKVANVVKCSGAACSNDVDSSVGASERRSAEESGRQRFRGCDANFFIEKSPSETKSFKNSCCVDDRKVRDKTLNGHEVDAALTSNDSSANKDSLPSGREFPQIHGRVVTDLSGVRECIHNKTSMPQRGNTSYEGGNKHQRGLYEDLTEKGDNVFFDTRNLNNPECPKHSRFSGISFIFEDHLRGGSGVHPKLQHCPTEASKPKVKPETNSSKSSTNETTSESLHVDASVSCPSECGLLGNSEKDKSSQCESLELMDCSDGVHSDILVMPKQAYNCTNDLMLPLACLPYASAPPFDSYPIGFTASAECVVDQSQVLSQASEQVLGSSSFQMQPPLPLVSPLYASYNCYFALLPPTSHEPFLTNHPSYAYREFGCEAGQSEVLLVPNYSDFPYRRKLNVMSEDLDDALWQENGQDHAGKDASQGSVPASAITDVVDRSDVMVKSLPDKINSHDALINYKENNYVDQGLGPCRGSEFRHPSRDDSCKTVVRANHFYNAKKDSAFNSFKKNALHFDDREKSWRGTAKSINEFPSKWSVRNGNGLTEARRDGALATDGSESSQGCLNKKITLSASKSSFDLESAQHYLLNAFEAVSAEGNYSIYHEE